MNNFFVKQVREDILEIFDKHFIKIAQENKSLSAARRDKLVCEAISAELCLPLDPVRDFLASKRRIYSWRNFSDADLDYMWLNKEADVGDVADHLNRPVASVKKRYDRLLKDVREGKYKPPTGTASTATATATSNTTYRDKHGNLLEDGGTYVFLDGELVLATEYVKERTGVDLTNIIK